jgi:hypothetical protein
VQALPWLRAPTLCEGIAPLRLPRLLLPLLPLLAACGTAADIVAAPFHVAADVVRVVPVVGDVVAAPLDLVGDAID